MPDTKQLWILAGGNGSGKSTFYRHYLEGYGIKFVNADIIANEIRPKSSKDLSYQAAEIAEKIRNELLEQGVSFCYETVFSHESKIDFIAKAKSLGYKIILVYIHLNHAGLNEARVFQRTKEGGHDVPSEKIYSRIPRTMNHIKKALAIVDEARILDNSFEKDRFRQIAVMKAGKYEIRVEQTPDWLKEILPVEIA